MLKKFIDFFMKMYDKGLSIARSLSPVPVPDPLRMMQRMLKKITGQ